MLAATCASGHDDFDLIIKTSLKCFAKNELKRLKLNAKPNQEEPPQKKVRTIRKLNSKGSDKK